MGTLLSSLGARRRWRAVVATSAIGLCVGLLAAPTAHADNTLASSSPAEGEQLASSPTSMVFTFTEALGSTNGAIVTCNGTPVSVGLPSAGPDGFTLTVAVPNPLPKGSCTAAVTVSAPDGSPNGTSTVSFTVASDTAVVPTSPAVATTTPGVAPTTVVDTTQPTPDSGAEVDDSGSVLGLVRLVTTLGLAVLLGSLVLILLAWPEGVEYILTVRFIRWAWVVALVGSFLTAALTTADLTGGSFTSALNPTTWTDLRDSLSGAAVLARVVLTAACGWVALRPERVLDPTTQLPAMALPALAVVTLGFSRTGGDLAAVGIAMAILHVLAMAVWFGGVVLLTRVVLAGPGDEDLVLALRGFGRIATPAILVTVLTGAVQTFRLDRGALFTSGHGRVLLLKALAVGAMVFVGMAARQFVNLQLSGASSLGASLASRLRRATGIEALSGVLVLVLTAWLVSFTPPNVVVADVAGEYGYSTPITADDLDIDVSVTGVVGPNAVLVEITGPASGMSSLVLTFVPPVDTAASTVVLTIPPELLAPGAVLLPLAEGVPLDAPGVWTLSVEAVTAAGTPTGQRRFTLLSA